MCDFNMGDSYLHFISYQHSILFSFNHDYDLSSALKDMRDCCCIIYLVILFGGPFHQQ